MATALKYIKRFAVKMTEENVQEIIDWSNRRDFVTSDFQVTMELNADEGLETYFVIEKHSYERGWRYYQIDSDEFNSQFNFHDGADWTPSITISFQQIKPV